MRTRTLTLAFLVACICSVAHADELVPRYDVFAGAKAMQDPTALMPDAYKTIESDMRTYRVMREQYDTLAEKAYNLVLDLGSREPKNAADLRAIAQEIESIRLQILQTYTKRQDLVKRMQSTPKGKMLWQSIVDVRPEYNNAFVSQYDVRFHDALMRLLTQSRDAYRALAQNPAPFTTGNGKLFFKTPEQSYRYIQFFTAMRSAVRDMVTSSRDKYAFLAKQPGILSLYGDEYMVNLDRTIKEKNAQLDQWSHGIPEMDSYAPLQFFIRVKRALESDEQLLVLRQREQAVQTEVGWSGALRAEDLVTPAALQKAQDALTRVTTAHTNTQQAGDAIEVRLGKELNSQYNLHRAALAATDSDFTSVFGVALTETYRQALREYNQKVLSAVQPCVAAKGKKKCTVKVLDEVTFKVSDQKVQRALDMLRASFVVTYQDSVPKKKETK